VSYSADEIARIVSSVVEQIEKGRESSTSSEELKNTADNTSQVESWLGVYPEIGMCVSKSNAAYEAFKKIGVSHRELMIREIRNVCLQHLEEIARLSWEETGLGRYEDKIQKNRLVIEKTPGTEDLNPTAFSGDFGLTIREGGAYGVIGAITPTTNPTETIINNSIGMIAAGNAVVFNPHPRAKNCCAFVVHLINSVVQKHGGPSDLVTITSNPSQESGQAMMKHPGVKILVVTGGPGIVQAAFSAGKKVIAAGPGNPPSIVDETADIDSAAKHIISGATLDNNVLCIAEKEVFVVDSVADEFIQALKRNGGYQLIGSNVQKLEKLILIDGKINSDLIGKNADYILAKIGINVAPEVRMAFFECDFEHFMVKKEQMMPVMPIVRVPNVGTAIDMAVEAEKSNYHTATMHSKNLDALHEMAVRSNVSIFVKNGPSYAGLGMGGEGFTTMTIAGPTGEGLTSARTFTRQRRCVLKGHFHIT
tara:strand:- start:896 stop:2332 length:1437 start_codon:yes stop_codon:yes gene_type:complete